MNIFLQIFLFVVKQKKPARVPPIDPISIKNQKQKSETIKSNNSVIEDFNTPPESPSLNSSVSLSLSSKIDTSRNIDNVFDKTRKNNDEKSTPPVPPPRIRRGLATKSAKNKLKELPLFDVRNMAKKTENVFCVDKSFICIKFKK